MAISLPRTPAANPANSAKPQVLSGLAAVRSLANRAHRPGPVPSFTSIPAFVPIATPPGAQGGIYLETHP